jgi:hypothetical protein
MQKMSSYGISTSLNITIDFTKVVFLDVHKEIMNFQGLSPT